jgi:hypothetical protein
LASLEILFVKIANIFVENLFKNLFAMKNQLSQIIPSPVCVAIWPAAASVQVVCLWPQTFLLLWGPAPARRCCCSTAFDFCIIALFLLLLMERGFIKLIFKLGFFSLNNQME